MSGLSLHVVPSGNSGHAHDKDSACCSHHELQSERYLLLYLLGGMLLVGVFIARKFFPGTIDDSVAQIPAAIAAVLLGSPLFYASIKELREGRASSSSLASLAIIASISMGKYETAGWLALILLVVDQLLRRTAFGAQRVIEQLVRLTPNVARVVRDGQEQEIGLAQVKVGDVVRVRPGENLPVDGVVVTGRTTIDQASLTGEAAPHEVQPGDPVYAGTTNLSGSFDLRCTQVGADTTIGKVTQLIREAEQSKTPRQLLIEQVARFYVPVVLSISFLVWFLTGGDIERAITVLVVTCPAALLIASPTAMVAAFAAAARLGIMIKQTAYLEAAADVDTVVMDKTGTITTGRFVVSRLSPAPGVEGAELLSAAANGEQHSNHPLARSILNTAKAARINPDGTNDYEEIHGRGVKARTSMGELHVGRATWLLELNPAIKADLAIVEDRIAGMTGVHVMRDGRYLGAVGLEDKVRSNTKHVIDRLRDLGIKTVSIFTGDRLSVAERVGRTVGVDLVEAECLPEEKHALVKSMGAQGRRTLMVGDGINDGPSLASADVGVAMGLSGSDIATNSAGVALMNDDLSRIPFLIELSRRNRVIIAQNIAIAIVVAIVGLALAATGKLDIFAALLFHFIADVLVILNSFRLFRFGEAYSGAEDQDAESQPIRRAASMQLAQPAAATA
ncbi:MAG: cation-translocating P-type ATPase [Phycisphaeraceae bacterium]|nr:cation-translocating P-type ATPase [Phycisphaeraceae bacterium]